MLGAALDGLGLAHVLEEQAARHIAAGQLVRFLEHWTLPFAGFFLYYPSRRQIAPTLTAFINELRRHRHV
jgi:DNA-binding transcriptional LysR family regulator